MNRSAASCLEALESMEPGSIGRLEAVLEILASAREGGVRGAWPGWEEDALALNGAWLRRRAVELNEGVKAFAGADHDERRRLAEGAGEFVGQVSKALRALGGDKFKASARKAMGLTKAEAEFLCSGLEDLAGFGSRLAEALREEQASGRAIKALRESPEGRRAVVGRAGLSPEDGYFAPLLDYLSTASLPSVKAELMAKMDLYVRSGWAAHDCLGPEPKAGGAAAAVRAFCKDPSKAAADPAVFARIGERFDELFVPIRISTVREGGVEKAVAEKVPRKASGPTPSAAGSGMVDAAIPDRRDPSLLHAAIATADASTFIENSEAYRHGRALADSLESLGHSKLRLSYFVPSLFYGAEQADPAKEISKPVLGALDGGLAPSEREALNAIPFLSSIKRIGFSNGYYDLSDLAEFRLELIGSGAEGLNRKMAAVRSMERGEAREEAFLSAVALVASEAVGALAKVRAGDRMSAGAEAPAQLLGALCETLEGLRLACAPRPAAFAPIVESAGKVRALAASITDNTSAYGRLLELSKVLDPKKWAADAEATCEADRAIRGTRAERERKAPRKASAPEKAPALDEKLFRAVEQSGWKKIAKLVARGADPLALDRSGRTPAQVAAAFGRKKVSARLREIAQALDLANQCARARALTAKVARSKGAGLGA